ncbi:hypothetical protein A6R68_19673 [Neotoma lepida]|uniref:Uncharacterized protein n=1 Tax=Neotoma lepida TaxID=56216 RepID=A0A1A6HI80_NEOLE|nr:hypothetical protein A6R68_19673 [Neotoma lepida]
MSSVIRKVISTTKAPAAIGAYSQAVLVDRTVYISGQVTEAEDATEVSSRRSSKNLRFGLRMGQGRGEPGD